MNVNAHNYKIMIAGKNRNERLFLLIILLLLVLTRMHYKAGFIISYQIITVNYIFNLVKINMIGKTVISLPISYTLV